MILRVRPYAGALAIALCVGCEGLQPTGQDPASDSPLVVLSAAADTRWTNDYDGTVHYSIQDPYPGSVVIGRLSEALTEAGWVEVDGSPLFSDPDRGARRWWSYYDELERKTHQWQGSWRDANGNMITYLLRYETPASGGPDIMKVTGIYTSAATVSKLRDEAEKRQK